MRNSIDISTERIAERQAAEKLEAERRNAEATWEAERQLQSALRGQLWPQDKAFQYKLRGGTEKGFTDMADYQRKAEAYYLKISAKRKANPRKGERNSARFAAAGVWDRVKPGVYTLLACIFAMVGLTQGWFFPDNGVHVFKIVPTAIPTLSAQAHDYTAMGYGLATATARAQVTLTPRATPSVTPSGGADAVIASPFATTGIFLAGGVGIAGGYVLLLRKRGKRGAKEPPPLPDPEPPSGE